MNVGLVGYGVLGKAFYHALSPKNNMFINDIVHEPDNKFFYPKDTLVEECDVILMAVPTPYSLSNGYVGTYIDEVLSELDMLAKRYNKRPTICIKSAILPSHCKGLIEVYTNIDITVSPEYLSGKNPTEDILNGPVLIVGGDKGPRQKVIDLWLSGSICRNLTKVGVCSAIDACMIKLMENTFLALKCVFMSEQYKLYEQIADIDSVGFNELLYLWQLDSRMGYYPYKIPYEGELGFDSHCLCKDINAMMQEGKEHNSPMYLLEWIVSYNDELRKDLDTPHKRCTETQGGIIE